MSSRFSMELDRFMARGGLLNILSHPQSRGGQREHGKKCGHR